MRFDTKVTGFKGIYKRIFHWDYFGKFKNLLMHIRTQKFAQKYFNP